MMTNPNQAGEPSDSLTGVGGAPPCPVERPAEEPVPNAAPEGNPGGGNRHGQTNECERTFG